MKRKGKPPIKARLVLVINYEEVPSDYELSRVLGEVRGDDSELVRADFETFSPANRDLIKEGL